MSWIKVHLRILSVNFLNVPEVIIRRGKTLSWKMNELIKWWIPSLCDQHACIAISRKLHIFFWWCLSRLCSSVLTQKASWKLMYTSERCHPIVYQQTGFLISPLRIRWFLPQGSNLLEPCILELDLLNRNWVDSEEVLIISGKSGINMFWTERRS